MTGRRAMTLLQQQIQTTLNVTNTVGIGWPPRTQLDDMANGKHPDPLVSIFDTGSSKDMTRWPVENDTPILVQTQLTSTLDVTALDGVGAVAHLTLGGTVQVNDAVSLSVDNLANQNNGVVEVVNTVVTLAQLASSFAASITNADLGIDATALGNVVTLVAKTSDSLALGTLTANVATANYEIRRPARKTIVSVWTGTAQLRETISNPIMTLIGKLSSEFGIQDVVNNQWVRVLYRGDRYIDKDLQLHDLYRRDFYLDLEYGETYQDTLYPVMIATAKVQIEPSNEEN